jgi:hypothetical protein
MGSYSVMMIPCLILLEQHFKLTSKKWSHAHPLPSKQTKNMSIKAIVRLQCIQYGHMYYMHQS